MSRHAVVLGGGVSGLAAAYRLSRAGWHVSLLEARDELGGLARSVPMGQARVERYYHFICGSDRDLVGLADELGIGGHLHWSPAPVGYWYQGRLYPFSTALDLLRFSPLSPVSRVRMGLHALRARRLKDWLPLDRRTAREWLVAEAGQQAYDVVWRPLLEVKFGPYFEQVSAAWMWHRIWRVGTSRHSPLKPDLMGYFDGGSAVLLDALVERIQAAGSEISLSCPAEAVRSEDGRVKSVATAAGEIEADAVIVAVPLSEAARLVADSLPKWSEALANLPAIAVVCGLFRLDSAVTPYFWVNINDSRLPINGFVEYSNLNRRRETWGGEILYVPLYLAAEDPRFAWSDDQWVTFFRDGLSQVSPGLQDAVTAAVVTCDRYAQPVCGPGFAQRVPPIAGPASGLFLVEASQLYPSDRTISGMIGLAGQAARLADEARD